MTNLEAVRAIFVRLCLNEGSDQTYITPVLSLLSEESLKRIILWFQEVMDKTGEPPKMYEMSNRISEEVFGHNK